MTTANLPSNVQQIAEQNGLTWGGTWKGASYDPAQNAGQASPSPDRGGFSDAQHQTWYGGSPADARADYQSNLATGSAPSASDLGGTAPSASITTVSQVQLTAAGVDMNGDPITGVGPDGVAPIGALGNIGPVAELPGRPRKRRGRAG